MASEETIARAFARIEEALLRSMIRNFEKHRVDQIKEGREWERWQSVQLAELNRYVRNNLKSAEVFDKVNRMVDELLSDSYSEGLSRFERFKLKAMRMGLSVVTKARSLLGIPTERLDTLIEATHSDLMRAEHAVLRKAEDDYRSIVLNAQIYATSGAGTYEQAIDMATKDLREKGLKSVTYRNGSRHSIEEYSRMAVRTAVKRAALVAEGKQRQEWGVHTIFVNYRVDACPQCMRWVGQVLVDDVYSGGTREEAEAQGYALLSDAMAQGLFHPNCRDTASTYFPGITQLPEKPSEEEMAKAVERESVENELSEAKVKERDYSRAAELSLDPENRERASGKADEWAGRVGVLELRLDEVSEEGPLLVPQGEHEPIADYSTDVEDAYLPQAVWDRFGEIGDLRTYSQARDWFARRGIELGTDLETLNGERADDEIGAVRDTVQQLAAAYESYSELFGPESLSALRRIVLYSEEQDTNAAFYYNQVGEDDPDAGTLKIRQWRNENWVIFHEFAHVLQASLAGDGEDALIFSERAVDGRLPDTFHAYTGSGDIAAERMADALGWSFARGDETGLRFIALLADWLMSRA